MADTYICPTCDHEVIVGQPCVVCSRNTKSTRKTNKKRPLKKAWQQDQEHDGLDLPEEDFDYDGYLEREFGSSGKRSYQKIGIAWYWWLTALLLGVVWIITMI